MSNPLFGYEADPFSALYIERVAIVESLHDSQAFENLLYANRLERRVEHTMKESIFISPLLLPKGDNEESIFPEALLSLFPDTYYEISDLFAAQTENDKSLETTITIAFKANGTEHSIEVVNDEAIHTTYNSNAEAVSYAMPSDIAKNLLALFTYCRQHQEGEKTHDPILAEDPISILRDPNAAMIERILMTLGNLDGSSVTSTSAIFDTGTQLLFAKLTEGERPHISHVNSKLVLEEILGTDMLTLHQNEVNVKAQPGKLENRYAELHSSKIEVPELIDPERDYTEWSRLCNAFLKVIERELATFAYLDADDEYPLD